MTLDDVCEEPHSERARLFLKNNFGKTAMSPDLTYEDVFMSNTLATAEMLDEIHFMLRTLLKQQSK